MSTGRSAILDVAASCRLRKLGGDVPPRILFPAIRRQMLSRSSRTSPSVTSFMTLGFCKGRSRRSDQSGCVRGTMSEQNKREFAERRVRWSAAEAAYLSAADTEENVVLRLVPRPFTTEMMATAMPAAMRPYSMAVAADSSRRKALSALYMA